MLGTSEHRQREMRERARRQERGTVRRDTRNKDLPLLLRFCFSWESPWSIRRRNGPCSSPTTSSVRPLYLDVSRFLPSLPPSLCPSLYLSPSPSPCLSFFLSLSICSSVPLCLSLDVFLLFVFPVIWLQLCSIPSSLFLFSRMSPFALLV